MISRKDHCFFLDLPPFVVADFLNLKMNKARKQIKQTVPLQHLFPQISGPIFSPGGIWRISGSSFAAFVKRQEMRCSTGKSCGHENDFSVHREVYECSPFELENGFARITSVLVLPNRVIDCL